MRLDTATAAGATGDASPVIGTDGRGNVVVVWQTSSLAPVDLSASRSSDSRATWNRTGAVNTGTNIGAGTTVGRVVVDPEPGSCLVTYQDVRSVVSMANAYVNRSTDFGASFAAADSRLDLGRTRERHR
ncbi:MAG: hypothetical protein U0514_03460 [Candidatus Andersenbacteria bacterium]